MSSQFGDNSFSETVSALLEQGDTVQILALFTEKDYNEVYNNACDLIPIVSRYLTEDCEYNNSEVFRCCRKVLSVIAEHSKPDEVLLQFIEEIELASDDTKFLTLLRPSRIILQRIPDKRITSQGWCFNAIKRYLSKIDVSEDFNLTGEERLLLDANETVSRINNLYDYLLIFYEVFVDELIRDSDASVGRIQILSKFLIDLLGQPLGFLYMGVVKHVKLQARIIAESLIEKFFSLTKDPFLYLELRNGDYNCELIKPNDLSLGVLYYLLLSEDVCYERIPKVYSPVYIFQNSIRLVCGLLTNQPPLMIEKGVNLAESLLKRIQTEQLPYLLLDSPYHSKFCTAISNTMIYNVDEEIRKRSLQIFRDYLWSFEHQGRYLIIMNLMPALSHSGLKGYIVMQYKEMLKLELEKDSKNLSRYYQGRKLFDLLDVFTLLKNKEETDLVDNSNEIVSTLNFLRYLVLVDKDGDTLIDWYLEELKEGYLEYLQTGLKMAKEHYRHEVKQIGEENLKQGKSDCEVSVRVSGKNLAAMPAEQKLEVLNMSLTTLDVIDSLLNRVVECIVSRKLKFYV